MRLEALTDPELIFADLACRNPSALLRSLAEKVVSSGRFDDADELFEKLWEREKLGSTGIGEGVAVPHCKMPGLKSVILSVALLSEGVDFGSVDEQPVRLVFLVVSPEEQPTAHLQCLAAISRWIKAERHVETILQLSDPLAIYDLLKEES